MEEQTNRGVVLHLEYEDVKHTFWLGFMGGSMAMLAILGAILGTWVVFHGLT